MNLSFELTNEIFTNTDTVIVTSFLTMLINISNINICNQRARIFPKRHASKQRFEKQLKMIFQKDKNKSVRNDIVVAIAHKWQRNFSMSETAKNLLSNP